MDKKSKLNTTSGLMAAWNQAAASVGATKPPTYAEEQRAAREKAKLAGKPNDFVQKWQAATGTANKPKPETLFGNPEGEGTDTNTDDTDGGFN